MTQLSSIEKIDTGILYVLELTSSISVLEAVIEKTLWVDSLDLLNQPESRSEQPFTHNLSEETIGTASVIRAPGRTECEHESV